MNQWTVPLEWNGGMEYWNDLWHFKINLEVICDMSVVAWICHGALNNVLHSHVAIACKLVNNSLAEGLIRF